MSALMNFQQARTNMVEQQIRPWEVLDQRVLDLLARMPREDFVGEEERRLAYADVPLPLPGGQAMMAPKVEARLLQALQLGPDDRVLEIGTGSGWVTALLAQLAASVVSVERSAELSEAAAARLTGHGLERVKLEVGDGSAGWPAGAPYDAIALTGSVPELDPALASQLAVGGRLFAVVGTAPAMEATLVRRTGESAWTSESLFETVVPPLEGLPRHDRFIL